MRLPLNTLFVCYYPLLSLASQNLDIFSECEVDFLMCLLTNFVSMYKQPRVAGNFEAVAPGFPDATSMLEYDRGSLFDSLSSVMCKSKAIKFLYRLGF